MRELATNECRDLCPIICDEMSGTWSPANNTCNLQVFVDAICYRLTKEN